MRSIIFLTAFLPFCVQAQVSPNPPIGGLSDPSLIKDTPIQNAKRKIVKDSIDRQYTPLEIEEYRKIVDDFDRAKQGIYETAAKVVRRRVQVGITPDSPVEEIRLNAENTGSVVFTDANGNPWNVADVIYPNYVTAVKSGNMIIFKPNTQSTNGQNIRRFGYGTITVLLEGLNSTIPFQLSYGNSNLVDGQIEAQIQARNPASAPTAQPIATLETDLDGDLFLFGEPPATAKPVKTSHSGSKAWLYNNKLYLRTTLPIHTPSYVLGGSSASGVSIYSFSPVPSIVNAIVDGDIHSVSIGEF